MVPSVRVTIEDTTERPLRADAERNRQRILSAAREVFATRGLGASLDDIAAHAGVGVGTVYRRFADKEALIDGLFEAKIARVTALATEALGIEDPWDGFETFVRGLCRMQADDRGFREALLRHDRGCEGMRRGRDAIEPVVRELLERAQRSGQVRPDLGVFDVPLLHFMVGYVADTTRDVAPDCWQRTLQIMLDGLRTSRAAPTPLPGAPLGPEQFALAVTRRRC